MFVAGIIIFVFVKMINIREDDEWKASFMVKSD